MATDIGSGGTPSTPPGTETTRLGSATGLIGTVEVVASLEGNVTVVLG